MSFKDLPTDWPDIPLTDPTHIANVLDIFVSMKTRMNGGLLVLLCDPLRCPMQPILVEDFGRRPPEDGDQALKNMATSIAEVLPGATVLCAIARRGGLSITADDRAWRTAITRAFADVPLIGVHVVTPDGSRLVHPISAAA
ncbi:MAG TPA: hypothetical protein P5544_16670 [Candidatus Nanopelagicales bacterium]|nr:hypothetical protein [Candidatus Nanopelagicales bacterium]